MVLWSHSLESKTELNFGLINGIGQATYLARLVVHQTCYVETVQVDSNPTVPW